MKKILIGVPTRATMHMLSFQSLYHAKIPEGYAASFFPAAGYTVVTGRNKIIEQAIKESYDFVFFLDDDIVIPPNIFYNLIDNINKGYDIAAGWYVKKDGSNLTTLMNPKITGKLSWLKADEVPQDSLISVFLMGLGCALIKTEVFKTLHAKDGKYFDWRCENGKNISEDVDFCNRAIKHGFKICCNTAMQCGHIGETIFWGRNHNKEQI